MSPCAATYPFYPTLAALLSFRRRSTLSPSREQNASEIWTSLLPSPPHVSSVSRWTQLQRWRKAQGGAGLTRGKWAWWWPAQAQSSIIACATAEFIAFAAAEFVACAAD